MSSATEVPWKRISVEAVAIVGSILLAFAIDAWWDSRQEAIARDALIRGLTVDFEANLDRLGEEARALETAISNAERFLLLSSEADTIALHDLRQSMVGAFRAITFEPSLSVYESAIATGKIELIQSVRLTESIAEFYRGLRQFQKYDDLSTQYRFRGPVAELERELGSLTVLSNPEQSPSRFRLSESEMREYFASRFLFSLVQARAAIMSTVLGAIRAMEEESNSILAELEEL